MYLNLPKSCLLGIVLTISTHSGPQVVYHYPPTNQLAAVQQQEIRAEETKESDKDKLNDEKKYNDSKVLNSSLARSDINNSVVSNDTHFHRHHHHHHSQHLYHHSDNDSDIPKKTDSDQAAYEPDSSSSDGDSTSGLSDSEMSTDYADCSTTSSSSTDENLSEQESEEEPIRNSTTLNTVANSLQSINSSSRGLRNRQSQISANKLFQLLNNEESRRDSVFSRHTTNKDGHFSDENYSSSSLEDNDDLTGTDKHKSGNVQWELDDQYFNSDYQDINKIFGFDSEFVAEFCCPLKEMCNTRFEFTVDDLCFLGLPIHINARGEWRKSKKKKHSNRSRKSTSTYSGRRRSSTLDSTKSLPKDPAMEQQQKDGTGNESLSYNAEDDETNTEKSNRPSDEYEGLEKSVNMFHVCFIMNPRIVEYNERVDDMYHYVVTRLSLILRYTQAKTNYVTEQCAQILRTKDKVLKYSKTYRKIRGSGNKGKYLYQKILSKSSLARALTKCFDSITRNEIANLEIDGDKIISLQIPIKDEFTILPDLKTNPVLRGSHLTSVLNSRFLEQNHSGGTGAGGDPWSNDTDEDDDLLDYALLLLNEPANIIQELELSSFNDDMANLIMMTLVKHLRPTVSLRSYQYLIDEIMDHTASSNDEDGSKRNSFQTSMLRSFALHLIYWRHARVIIPISSRNTYIVSPLAPIKGTTKDDFDNREINILEDKALIYQNHEMFMEKFPSLPSLPSFLSSISTSKPRSFGSIIPSKDHKAIYLSALAWLIRNGYLTQLLTFVWIRVDRKIKIAVDEDLEKEGFRKKNQKNSRKIANGAIDNVVERGSLEDLSKNDEAFDEFGYESGNDVIENLDYTIILDPERATAVEKRWLYKCIEGYPSDMQILFHKLVKYFNGKTPLELITIRESVSKHEIRRLLQALDKYAVAVRHW